MLAKDSNWNGCETLLGLLVEREAVIYQEHFHNVGIILIDCNMERIHSMLGKAKQISFLRSQKRDNLGESLWSGDPKRIDPFEILSIDIDLSISQQLCNHILPIYIIYACKLTVPFGRPGWVAYCLLHLLWNWHRRNPYELLASWTSSCRPFWQPLSLLTNRKLNRLKCLLRNHQVPQLSMRACFCRPRSLPAYFS